MADQLDNGEFWLNEFNKKGSSSSSLSFDPSSSSNETESDEDDSRQISRVNCIFVDNPKGLVFPTSPQSTLSPFLVGITTSPQQPPTVTAKVHKEENRASSFPLLNPQMAAKKLSSSQRGTGYFDCITSVTRLSPTAHVKNNKSPQNYNHQNRSPGLSPTAVRPPLLRHQLIRPPPTPPYSVPGMRMVFHGAIGTRKECAGTGVFLPRTANCPNNNLDSSVGYQATSLDSNACRKNSSDLAEVEAEFRLPSEWTY